VATLDLLQTMAHTKHKLLAQANTFGDKLTQTYACKAKKQLRQFRQKFEEDKQPPASWSDEERNNYGEENSEEHEMEDRPGSHDNGGQ